MNVRLLGAAHGDALDAADWYDEQTPGLGDRFLTALDTLVATLTTHPRLYGRVARAPAGREVRNAMVPGFPFVAAYEVTVAEVLILSIIHGHSAGQPWRGRLPTPPINPPAAPPS